MGSGFGLGMPTIVLKIISSYGFYLSVINDDIHILDVVEPRI
jgi:hypothetical protein